MAAFEDEFTDTDGVEIDNHTPDVGTGYTLVGSAGNVIEIKDNAIWTAGGGGSTFIVYETDDLGDADHQVWFQELFDPCQDTFVAVRLTDQANFVGYRLFGSGSAGTRLTKVVSGTETDLETDQGVANRWIRVQAEGDTFRIEEGGTGAEPTVEGDWTQIGGDHTVTGFGSETGTGFALRGTDTNAAAWIDSFRADVIGVTVTNRSTPFMLRGVG